MSPAKATRPGFRPSLASSVEAGQADQSAINLFHPIYHCYTYPIGARIDIERNLPVDLEREDEEELIDNFSEPPVWSERFSPLAVQLGDQVIRGKNAPELMMKIYRLMFDLFQGIGRFIENSVGQNSGALVRFPFLSLCVDPDTFHRIIETDYESGEASYAGLMKMLQNGTLAPCITPPFHVLLPTIESEDEIRILIRSSLIFYVRALKIYASFLRSNRESNLLVLPVWFPESGYSERTLRILHEEVQGFAKRERLGSVHLLVLLDNHQAEFNENDVLMKSWNQLDADWAANGNGRATRRKGDQATATISVVFRDRAFSDWVIHASPSVKKLLDRTIAKVDSDINQQNVHYGWAHFEELEAMTYNPRAIVNFQQKLVKLIELGYLPLAPDFYVRGKLRGEFGCTNNEPQRVHVRDGSIGNGWEPDDSRDLGRWLGLKAGHDGRPGQVVSRKYEQTTSDGKVQRPGSGAWKIAWHKVRQTCLEATVGDLTKLEGGMAEVLGKLTGGSGAKAAENVHDFLAHYTYVHWREHFIQHDVAEADINIIELCEAHLCAGTRGSAEPRDAAKAGAAAQAIYFAWDSGRSQGTAWENMDQRAFYQNVLMLTLAMCNAIYVYHWLGDTRSARKLLNLIKTELLDFETAFERYDLEAHGVSQNAWKQVLKSEIKESRDNVVRRAALRAAARHLRPLGYTKDFTRQDATLTTNVGHIWSLESCRENFCYENALFCGMEET